MMKGIKRRTQTMPIVIPHHLTYRAQALGLGRVLGQQHETSHLMGGEEKEGKKYSFCEWGNTN